MQRLYIGTVMPRRLNAAVRQFWPMTNPNFPASAPDTADETDGEEVAQACVLSFNANDPSGAGGLSADVTAMASVGAHPLSIVTGAYVRDTAEIVDHFAMDEDAVAEQARTILEDVPVQAIKVGFVGNPDNLSTIAEIATDYAEVPLIAYMPDLSWWEEDKIETYQDAFRELMLPQTTVLVGNHSTLWRWLLPDWSSERSPTPRDIAKAAAEMGTSYTLVTGIPLPDHFVENTLTSPQAVLCSEKFERFDAVFSGAGDTLSAALTALIASGTDLATATTEALSYLDRCLDNGFRPGMGHVIPDRLFWAQPEDEDATDDSVDDAPSSILHAFDLPPHDTQH
jgi:hydroxymethylpyrimidine/phosphomethylpyrimidine kinase